jgi:hypothetical protein
VELRTYCLMTRHAEGCDYFALKLISSALSWTLHSISEQYTFGSNGNNSLILCTSFVFLCSHIEYESEITLAEEIRHHFSH